MSADREKHWQDATGCSSPGDVQRMLAEKDAMIVALSDALEDMTFTAAGIHSLYCDASKTKSDGSHESAFTTALALVKKARGK